MNGDSICRATVTLGNKNGLHARPAYLLVQTANAYAASLKVGRDGMVVDGKSIMAVMMLAAESGAVLDLESEGPDCEDQIRAVRALIESKFGEDG
ncbi:MAG: HPr family phosphocarrier protein [Planctomycetota bacterium]